jgi:hypothetical protein
MTTRRLAVALTLTIGLAAAPATAAPNPALPPASSGGIQNACTSVATNNPNASETTSGHISAQGEYRFGLVGQAFCGV